MEKLNFTVESNHALDIGGQHIDLHNNFDFSGLEYLTDRNQVCLSWIKSSGDWVPDDEIEGLMVVFDNVLLLRIEGSPDDVLLNRTNLSFLGYLHPEDIEVMDGCLDENESNPNYHMIFVFENDLSVKIFSDKAKVKIKQ